MKSAIVNIKGEKVRDIEMPECFSYPLREDVILKYFELSRKRPPYAPFYMAGFQMSAAGNIKHGRRKWKTAYGHGISRVPRKIFSRSGDRFSWQGATVTSARGGRQAHPPKVIAMLQEKKINKKEGKLALYSAISATSNPKVLSKYGVDAKKLALPLIVDSLDNLKIKDLSVFAEKFIPGIDLKKVLFVTSSKEEFKVKTLKNASAKDISISDLCPSGKPSRITVYTEKAITELKEKK